MHLANDISRGTYNIARVRQTLRGAFEIMTAAAYMHAGIISSRRDGRRIQLMARSHPEELSILASVMGVTQEVFVLHVNLNSKRLTISTRRSIIARSFKRSMTNVSYIVCLVSTRDPRLAMVLQNRSKE